MISRIPRVNLLYVHGLAPMHEDLEAPKQVDLITNGSFLVVCTPVTGRPLARLPIAAIQPPEARQGKVDDALAGVGILEVLVAGGCAAAGCRDLGDDTVGDRRIEAAAVLGHAGIVLDDGTAARRNEPGVGGAETSPSPGDDGDLSVKANRRHDYDDSANAARPVAVR